MVEQVNDRTFYHVTVAKPYKQAFVQDQVVQVGQQPNPFFGFYEGSREYPVTQGDGSVLQVKAVAFLTHVRDGAINSPQFAAIATEVATHYVMLARELVMEQIREDEFPCAPSRQRCLFVCNSLEEAHYWQQRIGDGGVVCSLRCSGTIHRADARLLLGDSEPLSVTKERSRQYWRGEASNNPEWETLFEGDAVVTAIGL